MVEDTSTPERAPTEDLEPDDELAMLFLTNERIKELWYDINDLYDIVVNDVRGHFDETEAIIDDLKRARELLLADREHFDNAEEIVMDVKAKLRLQVKVRHWNRTHVPWVGIYLFTWLAGLLAFSLFVPTIQEAATGQFNLPGYLSATILPSVWGGFGAVFGAMWALIDHSAIKRDFDPIHVTWFYLNPIMGLAIGVLTYAVILGSGILGATLVTGGAETEMFSRAVEGGSRVGLEQLILYGVCAIVGFKQNIFWQLIQQTLKTILPGSASNLVTTSGTGPYSDK